MTIKFDRLFEGIHDKCRILFNNLIPSIEERCMYSDLFLLKNMESLEATLWNNIGTSATLAI